VRRYVEEYGVAWIDWEDAGTTSQIK